MPANPGTVGAQLRAARDAFDLTQSQAARMLGVSSDMVSAVERGTKGAPRGWSEAVSQLATRGVVVNPPPRRQQRVRAPGGRTVPAPKAAPGLGVRRTGRPAKYGVQRGVTRQGGHSVTVDAPSRGEGRELGRQTLIGDVRAIADDSQRVRIQVTDKAGRTYTIGAKGGYRPGALAQAWEDEGDDPYAWISDTLDGMGYDVPPGAIVSVVLIWGV